MKDPLTAEEHNNLGVIYEREGKHELALREYKRASAIDGELVTPIVNTGNVYLKLGKYKKAVKYYKKALKKDPANIEAANNLASAYIETGENLEEGLSYLLAATKLQEPVPAYALDTVGVLYLKTGDRGKARKYLTEACKSASGSEELKEEIKSHLAELGEYEGCESEK
ncbi:MAG: tetratricopeptide repeat protein [Deltaproteobacteria bacterium]